MNKPGTVSGEGLDKEAKERRQFQECWDGENQRL